MVEEAKTVAEAAGPLARLGVDWRLLVAQLVNFGLVLFVMWKWVYRPLLKVMEERSGRIERGLKDAADAAEAKQTAAAEKEAVVTVARQEAKRIIEEADGTAKEVRETHVRKTREEMEAVVAQGKARLAADRAAMVSAAKTELADLVVAATGKVLSQKMDGRTDAALAASALAVEAGDRSAN
jgi:F-type H+-transporting ATPase subunit b